MRDLCAATPHGVYLDTADSVEAMALAFDAVTKLINAQELASEFRRRERRAACESHAIAADRS
jgi:hypothetical protein